MNENICCIVVSPLVVAIYLILIKEVKQDWWNENHIISHLNVAHASVPRRMTEINFHLLLHTQFPRGLIVMPYRNREHNKEYLTYLVQIPFQAFCLVLNFYSGEVSIFSSGLSGQQYDQPPTVTMY